MKRIFSLLLLISLFSSIAIGEDACCSLFEDSSESQSIESDQVSHELHICENEQNSSNSHDDHTHYCFGCFHSPFLKAEYKIPETFKTITKFNRPNLFFFIANPYLDGPFQPPNTLLV